MYCMFVSNITFSSHLFFYPKRKLRLIYVLRLVGYTKKEPITKGQLEPKERGGGAFVTVCI
jgi:hypothetical protein